MDLSKKVFGGNVSKEIIKYFDDLQRGGFDVELSPLSEIQTLDYQSYLGDRTPYARMWTAVNVKEEINDGEGFDKTFVYSINENREGSYNPNELDSLQQEARQFIESSFGFDANYRPQLDNNSYLKPTAGITSINSKSEGAVGALRRTTVNFIVHNKQDFDNIFLPFFLKPGATVFVDFGWSDKALSLYNPESLISNDNPSMNDFYKRVYDTTLVEKDIKKGLQTTLSGQVTKYDVTVDDKGSFSCTLEFVSSNYALLDKTVSDDNDLKFIFKNAIEEMLMNYYLKISNIRVETNEKDENAYKKVPISERKKLVNDFFDLDESIIIRGQIDTLSLKSGVFYHQLSAVKGNEDKLDGKESLYISYGLFEDLFLNQFISFWEITDDSGKTIETLKSEEPFSNSFSSINSYVRYDADLFNLMSKKVRSDDELTSFLFPANWDDTYNKIKPNGNNGTDDDIRKRRIPIRDLFISVPVISEAFERSTNVNDALEFIFDKIYEDSANILNIKMMANNDAQTSITFQDVNVQAETFEQSDEDILTFDLTSGNSVVLNSDLKFETPKAGLSSMIAIGNIDNLTVFDELELIKFNFLNSINTENRKLKVQHLPLYGNQPSKLKALDIKMDEFLLNVEKGSLDTKHIKRTKLIRNDQLKYNDFVKERKKAIEDAKKDKKSQSKNKTNEVKVTDLPSQTSDGKQIFYAKSERDEMLLKAKINNFVKTHENSISPVMPITLNLKVYGNNFLGIGDFFTVNFLPSHYQDRVYFQVVGVDHSVETAMWDTTYTTVMRLKSTKKYTTKVNTQSEEKEPRIEKDPEFIEKKATEASDNVNANQYKNQALPLFTKNIINERDAQTTYINNRTIGQVDYGQDVIPELAVTFETHVVNAEHNKEKVESLNQKFISKTKLATTISFPETYNEALLAYHIAISNLMLGDELIDWKKVKDDYIDSELVPFDNVGLVRRDARKLIPRFGAIAYELSTLDKNTEFNRVMVIPRNINDNLNTGEYKDILGYLDDIEEPWWESDLFIDLDENEKPVDEAIQNIKQNLSTDIELGPIVHNVLQGDVTYSGYFFFYGMIWEILEGDNNFVNINIQGPSEFNLYSNIVIPEKYLKMNNPKKFIDRLRKDYVIRRLGNVDVEEFFTRVQKENPGFPFTEENFNVTTQFGSHGSAADAREALAAAYTDNEGNQFNSYNAYKNARDDRYGRTRSLEVRKQDWLNRDDIW
jgi:hypothetical protein